MSCVAAAQTTVHGRVSGEGSANVTTHVNHQPQKQWHDQRLHLLTTTNAFSANYIFSPNGSIPHPAQWLHVIKIKVRLGFYLYLFVCTTNPHHFSSRSKVMTALRPFSSSSHSTRKKGPRSSCGPFLFRFVSFAASAALSGSASLARDAVEEFVACGFVVLGFGSQLGFLASSAFFLASHQRLPPALPFDLLAADLDR